MINFNSAACYDEGERKLKDKGHLMLFQIIQYIFQNIDEVKTIQQKGTESFPPS